MTNLISQAGLISNDKKPALFSGASKASLGLALALAIGASPSFAQTAPADAPAPAADEIVVLSLVSNLGTSGAGGCINHVCLQCS